LKNKTKHYVKKFFDGSVFMTGLTEMATLPDINSCNVKSLQAGDGKYCQWV